MLLSYAAKLVNGKLINGDAEFQRISTDTRSLTKGDVFLALRGENYDGHDYVAQAVKAGAVGIIVSRPVALSVPSLLVENTLLAYGELAKFHRQQFHYPLIALTGSCGKTTTRAMLAAVLKQQGAVLATEGTFNNAVGVPKTLLQLTDRQQFAVVELGTNHFGEIDYITHLAQPDIALITNAGPSHLEFLNDVPSVAREKASIFNGLKSTGTAVINADDEFSDYWRSLVKDKRVITFGKSSSAEVKAENIVTNAAGKPRFDLVYHDKRISIQLSLLGEHNVMNALAAAACALTLKFSLADIKHGLEQAQAEAKRLVEKTGKNGVHVIDDTYNANPASVNAAIAILAQHPGKKILVLGQMNELGNGAPSLHKQVGAAARLAGIDELYTYGELTRYCIEGFGQQGHYYITHEQLAQALLPHLMPGVTILVKGSRGMRMENIVDALL